MTGLLWCLQTMFSLCSVFLNALEENKDATDGLMNCFLSHVSCQCALHYTCAQV